MTIAGDLAVALDPVHLTKGRAHGRHAHPGRACGRLVLRVPLGRVVHGVIPLSGTVFDPLWFLVSLLLGIVVMGVLFSALYYVAPKRDNPRWQWVSPSRHRRHGHVGFVLARVFLLCRPLRFLRQDLRSLRWVVILVLWLYLTGLAILAGANSTPSSSARRRCGPTMSAPRREDQGLRAEGFLSFAPATRGRNGLHR